MVLALYVSFVFYAYLGSFECFIPAVVDFVHFGGQCFDVWGEVFDGHTRTSEQVDEPASAFERCGSYLAECVVDECRLD